MWTTLSKMAQHKTDEMLHGYDWGNVLCLTIAQVMKSHKSKTEKPTTDLKRGGELKNTFVRQMKIQDKYLFAKT